MNNAFSLVDGKWVFDFDKPYFREKHELISQNSKTDSQLAKPRAVWAEEYRGGELLFYLFVSLIIILFFV